MSGPTQGGLSADEREALAAVVGWPVRGAGVANLAAAVEAILAARLAQADEDRAAAPVAGSGRPSSERDGPCICDYNPDTTEGPEEACPFHGRPYRYWVECVDRAAALAGEWTTATCQTDGAPCSWHRVAAECAAELRAALTPGSDS